MACVNNSVLLSFISGFRALVRARRPKKERRSTVPGHALYLKASVSTMYLHLPHGQENNGRRFNLRNQRFRDPPPWAGSDGNGTVATELFASRMSFRTWLINFGCL